jgi:hypothetical protein
VQPTLEDMKAWLNAKLGREVTVSQVTVNGTRCYLVDYINHGAPATKLVGATEDEAIAHLFNYLFVADTVRETLETSIVGETKG